MAVLSHASLPHSVLSPVLYHVLIQSNEFNSIQRLALQAHQYQYGSDMRSRARYFYGNMLRKIGPTKSFIRLGSYRSFDIYNRSLNRRENEKLNQRLLTVGKSKMNWEEMKNDPIIRNVFDHCRNLRQFFNTRTICIEESISFVLHAIARKMNLESLMLEAWTNRFQFQLIIELANKVARKTFYDC